MLYNSVIFWSLLIIEDTKDLVKKGSNIYSLFFAESFCKLTVILLLENYILEL